jgi:Fe/S biogenesis protein NfuA
MDEVIRVSPAALDVVREALAREPNADSLALWLEVNGISNGAYSYDLWFATFAAMSPGDAQDLKGGVRFVVPAESVDRLRGAVLDASDKAGEAGLVIVNPNAPSLSSRSAVARGDMTGPVAKRVLEVLARDVNPFIASHGGHVELVGLDGPTAYVELSGGCHGCGMARATLSQGIAVAITDSVSEIKQVVDVTDHLSGQHPYLASERSESVVG